MVLISLFIALYLLKNVRRPMNVSYISNRISSETMASGLSIESLMKTLVAAILAPLIGYTADLYGVGIALVVLGVMMAALYPVASVRQVA